ncbi:hypothetical protein I317_02613 [Kwoniella heveanensis CBS 569]|uniref:Glycosyl transferase CAP10 domain-containing protein n=1 Tax=Kwoniella heveanensis BCC8398 TaxID=1296120 RepID=A0A1B9GQY5_9TREE|nr:hypothetical protein I316_04900 [Kwoniella heveanensis BCC8398]OCF43595.1 hypothetical protein I317_02613 [Kwoniella heveanensis CBS 569]
MAPKPSYNLRGGISPKRWTSKLPSHSNSNSLHGGIPPSSSSSAFPLSSVGMIPPSVPRQIKKPRKILWLVGIFFLLYWFGIRHGLGRERIPPPPLGFAVKGGRRGRRSSLFWGDKGMATLLPQPQGGVKPEHPIYELMERAETRWENLLASQSKTLHAAVLEYKKRYGIPPPVGFDAWFEFCQKHGIKIVDEYDQLMKDLLPHHALPPALFISRSKDLEGKGFTYTLDIGQGHVELTGDRSWAARPKHLRTLINGFKEFLPEGFYLKITGSDHDTGSTILGKDQRERAMQLVKEGKHFDEAELKALENPNRTPAWGWFVNFPSGFPLVYTRDTGRCKGEADLQDLPAKSFIHDHLPTMDFCDYPEWKRLHGAMSLDYAVRSPSILRPILVLSKFPMDASFQTTPMEAYMNVTESDLETLGSWEEKTDNRLFWRGSTTGGYGGQRSWKESHRLRLHLMINGPKGGDTWWEQHVREVMLPDGQGSYKIARRWEKVLGRAYADVKLAGKPVQCPSPEICQQVSDTIEFGDKVWPDQAAAYKYNLDVDGNGWSSRFHRLLSTGSPVIKFTMFPEWHAEWLTPWYHYIPLKPDYSDLYDIMAFFVGPVDETGNVDETKGHDYLAKKIGEAGQRFAVDHWSWENMQAYMFRLLLELQRLHSLDREIMSYKEPVTYQPPQAQGH